MDVKRKLAELEEDISQLQEEKDNNERDLLDTKKKNSELENKLEAVEKEKADLEVQLYNLKQNLLRVEAELRDALSNKAVLDEDATKKEDLVKRLNEDINRLKGQLTEAQRQIDTYRREADIKDATIAALKAQLGDLEQENDNLRAELSKTKALLEAIEEESRKLQIELNAKNEEIYRLNEEIDITIKKNEELQNECIVVADRVSTVETSYQEFKSFSVSNDSQLENERQSTEQLQREIRNLTAKIKKLEERDQGKEVDHLKAQLEAANEEIATLQDRLAQVEREKTDLERDVTVAKIGRASCRERV